MKREESIRKEILLQLYAVRPLALSAGRIARDARKNGYDYTEREIRAECQFLEDRDLIFPLKDPAGAAPLYRIHAEGVACYEEHFAA